MSLCRDLCNERQTNDWKVSMKELILHSIKMHKVQTVSVIVSVALSTMIVVTLGLMYGGVQQGIATSKERGGADIMAVPADALQYIDETELLYTGAPAPVYMDADIVDSIASIDGVVHASPQFFGQTLNSGCCSTTGETRLIGIDPETDFIVRSLTSDEIVSSLGENEVIVGSGVGGVYDNELTILNVKYTVVGVMAETGTSFDSSIVGDIDLVRDICRNLEGYEHYWEKHGDPSGLISCIMIDVEEGNEEAMTSVQAKINLTGGLTPLVRSEIADKATSQLQSVFFLLAAAAVIMAIVVLLQLFARFYSSVWDRKKELALYRAIGASKSNLRKLVILEMEILVISGLVVGIILGFVAQYVLLGVVESGLSFPFVSLGIGQSVALVALVVAALEIVSIISIIVPLRQIGRLDPSTAMQQGDID